MAQVKQGPFSRRQWPLQQDCVLGLVEPVVAVQKIQVPRGVVHSHDSGDLEKILRVEACATVPPCVVANSILLSYFP